ncbi:MAG TPA: putative Ig domain-containing protein, partial [Blastocatellia bacterium]|nr:putative Ig domain-containing protein [Blastocatellia bacterium]
MRSAIFQPRSNRKLTAAFFSAAVLAFSIAAAMIGYQHHSAPMAAVNPTLNGEAAIEKLRADGSYDSLAAGIAAARYQINHQVNQEGSKWLADNPAQKFNASFTGEELRITDFGLQNDRKQAANPQWEFGLKLKGFGYGDDLSELGQGELTFNGNRIEIRKSAITEWYVNKPEGLEQGFTLNAPPIRHGTRSGSDGLRLSLQVIGDLNAETVSNQAVILKDKQGRAALSYDKLAAWDADGKSLAATMSVHDNEIMLNVDDRDARYPVIIDPLISQQQKWLASDGAGGDAFGTSIAISGNFAIVGAWGDDSDKGSAYVFLRGASGFWSQQVKLTASDGAAGDNFGRSVSISGNTAVIGAWRDNLGNNQFQGSVYVFTYNNPAWTQQAKLLDNNGGAFDQFGQSVSISGNTLVVGAHQHNPNGVSDQGAAYVYYRSGNTWTLQQKLIAADGAAGDNFGQAVAINGNTIAVTASGDDVNGVSDQGSMYVFTRSGAIWTQQQKLVAADGQASDRLGTSVAMSSDTIVVGAASDNTGANGDQGAAYVFARSGATWSQQQKLTANDGAANDYFGISVALYGQIVVIGAEGDDGGANGDQGAAYVFARVGASWTQQNKLTAADGAQGDNFGHSVAIEGDAILTGAYLSGGTDRGAAYFYSICGDIGQLQQILANVGISGYDNFGGSIAVSGNTAVIGAHGWSNYRGEAFVFTRVGNSWLQTHLLTAPNGSADDFFGGAVAIDGDTIVVGALKDDFAGDADRGSVYVFARNGGTWGFQAYLSSSDGAAGDVFGSSVAISGDTMLVGSPGKSLGFSSQGAAYIFLRNAAGFWSEVQQLTGSNPAMNDQFGGGVALEGDTALIAAKNDDFADVTDKGSVYYFKQQSPNVWAEVQKFTPSDGNNGAWFGTSIALNGNLCIIGAVLGDNGVTNGGSAYIYALNGSTWTLQQKLTASDASSNDYFGVSVALSGDWAVVGAQFDAVNGNANRGSAYMFRRDQGVWTQQKKLVATDGATGDWLGSAVALSGEQALVGAQHDDVAGVVDKGSVYVFGCTSCPAMTISPSTLPVGTVGNAYNLTLTVSGGSAPYQFSVSNGSLPPGLTLAQGGQISGFAGASGSFTFTVTVMTQNLCTDSRTYTMTINGGCPSFSLNPATLPNGTVNTVYSQTLLPTGGAAPFTFSHTGTLPTGVSLNTQTGVLSGVPTTAGGFNFGITATDSNGCQGGKSYTVTINSVGGVSATDLQFYPLAHPVR